MMKDSIISEPIPFVQIPNFILDGTIKLKNFEIVVYCNLLMRANKEGKCFPSHKRIAKDCGISVASVQRAITSLIDIGLVVKENIVGSSNNYYIRTSAPKSERPRGSVRETEGGRSERPSNNTKVNSKDTKETITETKVSKRNILFEKICIATGTNYKDIPPSQRSSFGKAVKELKELYPDKSEEVIGEEVLRRAMNYVKKMPEGCILTVHALMKHWGSLSHSNASGVNVQALGASSWEEAYQNYLSEQQGIVKA